MTDAPGQGAMTSAIAAAMAGVASDGSSPILARNSRRSAASSVGATHKYSSSRAWWSAATRRAASRQRGSCQEASRTTVSPREQPWSHGRSASRTSPPSPQASRCPRRTARGRPGWRGCRPAPCGPRRCGAPTPPGARRERPRGSTCRSPGAHRRGRAEPGPFRGGHGPWSGRREPRPPTPRRPARAGSRRPSPARRLGTPHSGGPGSSARCQRRTPGSPPGSACPGPGGPRCSRSIARNPMSSSTSP